MATLKLELNTKDLETLLCKDSKIDLELKQWVVEEFSRRHIKQLMNDDLIQKIKSELNTGLGLQIKQLVADSLGIQKQMNYPYGYFIDSNTKRVIHDAIYPILKDLVEEQVKSYDIKSQVERLVPASITAQVQEKFNQKMKQLAASI